MSPYDVANIRLFTETTTYEVAIVMQPALATASAPPA
jgi:hypothetical protein